MKVKCLVLVVFVSFNVSAQLIPFGLTGQQINSIKIIEQEYPERMAIAGTESNGIYFHALNETDSLWGHHYFNGAISALYTQQIGIGPGLMTRIFAALKPDSIYGETPVFYTDYPVQSYWAKIDSGLDKSESNEIISFAGFGYIGHEPPRPVFATAGDSIIYILKNDVWEKSWIGSEYTTLNVLYSNDSAVWAGGIVNNVVAALILIKSENDGKDWKIIYPPFGEIFSCYSIVTPPGSSDTVYTGLNGMIIKSTNGGVSWDSPLLQLQAVTFNSLVINPLNREQIFAGGKTLDNFFVLYKSKDGGITWEQIMPFYMPPSKPIKGINSMAGTIIDNEFVLFIGTDGTGAFKYIDKLTLIDNDDIINTKQFHLYQNYPNPFNPITKIRYSIPNVETRQASSVQLKVFDILGNEVATLVNEQKEPGYYEVNFDASQIASGVYIYGLTAGKFISTKKMMVLK